MPDRRNPPADPRSGFVVETELKPDGRRIHYYEWPEPPKEPREGGAGEAGKAPRPEKLRV